VTTPGRRAPSPAPVPASSRRAAELIAGYRPPSLSEAAAAFARQAAAACAPQNPRYGRLLEHSLCQSPGLVTNLTLIRSNSHRPGAIFGCGVQVDPIAVENRSLRSQVDDRPAPGKLSGSGFWVQDLEHVAADPPMPYARPYSGFFHDAYSGEPAQDICGAGLTQIQFVLYVPDGENRVSE